jgi:hypothetical protein
MRWIVSTEEGDINFNSSELVLELLAGTMKNQRPSHEELICTFIDYLESKNTLSKCTPYQIALMAMDLGYFYKIFLIKNKVTINNDHESNKNSRTSSEIPSNT